MSALRNWGRGIVGVLAAGSIGACVTAAGYSGMGVLQISGQPPLLTELSVKLASCAGPAPGAASSASSGPLGGPDGASQSYAVLSLGPNCRIVGDSSGLDFRPTVPATCTLDFAEGQRSIRVAEAAMHFGYRGNGGDDYPRQRTAVDISGADVATGKFVLFRFTGSSIGVDPDPAACGPQPTMVAR